MPQEGGRREHGTGGEGRADTTGGRGACRRSRRPHGDEANEFQGHHLGANVSIIVVDAAPGSGPKLHRHSYEEVFVVQEGTATFTAGDETIEVRGGQIVVVPPGVPHKFVNSGTGRLRQVDIHASERFVTEWLEA